MLDNAIQRLYETGVLKACAPTELITSYSYAYQGRLVEQPVTVDPRMKAKELARIVENACGGSLADMVTLAHLYNVGYGVPYNSDLADAWIAHSTMQPAKIGYDRCCEIAHEHMLKCPEEILPDPLTFPCMRIIEQIEQHSNEGRLIDGAYVMPRLKGIRVYLIYRNIPGRTPHLYAGFYRDKENVFLEIDKLIELGAPRSFGEIRNRETIRSYTPFGQNAMYVVAATIYVPTSMRAKAAQLGKSVREVFNLFMQDKAPVRTRDSFNVDFFVNKLEEDKKLLHRAEHSVKRLRDAGKPVPQDKLLQLSEMRVRVQQTQESIDSANPQAEYEAYLEKLPRNYLRMIAHELYRWNRKELVAADMCRQTQTHLQSLGFTSMNHPALEFVGYIAKNDDVAETVNIFEKTLDAKVQSLIVSPGPKSGVRFINISRIDIHD